MFDACYNNYVKINVHTFEGTEAEFVLKTVFGYDSFVTPDVLIPKPDTEILVEKAIIFLEEKINAMSIDELERLVYDVMKKELNAIVNLGALIGFILGLINLLI